MQSFFRTATGLQNLFCRKETNSCFFFVDFIPTIIDHDANCTLPNPRPPDYQKLNQTMREEWENNKQWRCMIKQSTLGQMAKGT